MSPGAMVMEMVVRCPGCQVPLRVPRRAGGHPARCPACRQVFTVPREEELIEDAASNWIEQDVQKMQEEMEQTLEERGKTLRATRSPRGPRPVPWGSRDMWQRQPVPASTASRSDARTDPRTPLAEPAADHPDPASSASAGPDNAGPATAENPAPPTADHPPSAAITIPDTAHKPGPSGPDSAPHPPPSQTAASHPAPILTGYPTDLLLHGRRPYVLVDRCSQDGVRFCFDASCLEHLGFRASMPIRGAFDSQTQRAQLLARPVAWIDRSGAAIRNPQDIELKYEQPVHEKSTPRELIAAMRLIEGLPRPFSLPMVYYVSAKDRSLSLPSQTHTRHDGGITCSITIACPTCALEWLARVNGVCGPEYELLEHELALLTSDTWRTLGDVCRQRLTSWCRFQPGERFALYLPDADFGQHDLGLAGIVLTDSRLVYHKFHRGGSVDLHDKATLLARVHGSLYEVLIDNDEGRHRVANLAPDDLARLRAALASADGLRVVVA